MINGNLLTATKTVYINSQLLCRSLAQSRLPGWHHALSWLVDLGNDIGMLAAIEPKGVRKARGTDFADTLSLVAMAGSTVVGKNSRTPCSRFSIKLLAGDLADMPGNIRYFLTGQYFVHSISRHVGNACVIVAGMADAVLKGCINILNLAAPNPVIVIEIGISGRTCSSRTMALNAVNLECRLATGYRKLGQVGILLNLLHIGCNQFVQIDRLGSLGIRQFSLDCGAA